MAIVMWGGVISEVITEPRSGDVPKNHREASGLICPGFIDIQLNGSFGIDVGYGEPALVDLAAKLPRSGTTSFLPTAISRPLEHYHPFLEALRKASSSPGARILGAHMEGPFLSPIHKGAHDPGNILPVDLGLLGELLSSGMVRAMTLAPELQGADQAVQLLRESGAVASIGHTDATYEEALRSIDAGFSKATHLYNAMSPLEHRAPGAVTAALTEDRLRAGIIPDGIHAHEGALRLAYREKGAEGLALVTDATEAAGMRDGEYQLGGRRVRLEAGSVRLPDGTLAGSALTMDAAVRNAKTFLGISIQEAVRMASQTPAEILGLSNKGRIAAGADADLTVLDPNGLVQETIVAGETVYKRVEIGDHG